MANKIKSIEELRKIKARAQNTVALREKGDNIDNMIQVRVAMATCGIASGAREVMNEFIEEFNRQHMDNAVVTQTGCMGYCYAEPTIELTMPGKAPIIYGYVNKDKVHEIIEKTIKTGELIDGIINNQFQTIE